MFELISVDDHLIEPVDLWQRRLPLKLRSVGPRIVRSEEGPRWLIEDKAYSLPVKTEFCAGLSDEHLGYEPHSLLIEDMVPEFYDSAARARVLLEQGITASICFPAMPKYAGTAFLRTKDKDLAASCISAWNDFLFEEWCAGAPGFYIPAVLVQLWDPTAAATEVRRCAELGARAVSMCENGAPLGLPSFHSQYWDPLWQAIEETGLVVCMHVGTGGKTTKPSSDTSFAALITLVELNAMASVIELLFGPVPRRFPGLQFVLCESGAAWVPGLMERADREWEIHRPFESNLPPEPPSDIFSRSFSVSFVGDPVSIALRSLIGVDRMMFGCDFPHTESPYPAVQQRFEGICAGVPQGEIDLLTNANARRVFRWPDQGGVSAA